MTGVAKKIYGWMKKRQLLKPILQRDRDKLRRLFPGESGEKQLEQYYVETIVLLMKIGIVGVVVLIVVLLQQRWINQEKLSVVERNEYGGGTDYVNVVGYGENGFCFENSLEIPERQYTEQELQVLYEELLPVLEDSIKGNNKSLLQVQENLVFPEEVKGFPFQISWRSYDSDVITSNGELSENYRELEGTTIVTATFTYNNFTAQHSWDIQVMPSLWTEEQIWKFNVEKALRDSGEESLAKQQWFLPTEINGEKIYWEFQGNNYGIKISGLLLICMILVIWGRNNDLQRKLKQRDLDLEEEYCNVVTKLTLYLGAGMTVKNAWRKVAMVGTKRSASGTAGREMLLTCREMDSGVYENVCYENFGRRCGRQEYVRLGTLLSQNLRKGNSELLNRLQEEVQLSEEKQMHLIKRRGEEASTKLLGPMILLLGITMVLIMIPAFSGIS